MTAVATRVAERLDPFRACPGGVYDDGVVRVERIVGRPWPGRAEQLVAAAYAVDGRVHVAHRLPAALVDDEAGVLLADALAPFTDDHDVFARAFCGLVLTTAPEPADAWQRLYRNTLALLRQPDAPGYTAVYRHALDLLPRTSVLDLGCSLGFLGLHLAAEGARVTACDVDAGTTRLLQRMSALLHRPLTVHQVAPASPAAPALTELPDRNVDAVALLHVLEHVDDATGARLLTAAQRIARHRVVVAVPYEPHATPLYGHVRTLDAAQLHRLGARSGWTHDLHDASGGWQVLDRPGASTPDHPTGWPNRGEGARP